MGFNPLRLRATSFHNPVLHERLRSTLPTSHPYTNTNLRPKLEAEELGFCSSTMHRKSYTFYRPAAAGRACHPKDVEQITNLVKSSEALEAS